MATHSHLQKDPGVIQPSQGSPVSAPFPAHNGRELEEPTAPWLMMSPTPGSMALPGKQQASWGCIAFLLCWYRGCCGCRQAMRWLASSRKDCGTVRSQ